MVGQTQIQSFFTSIFHSYQSQLNWRSFIWTAASLMDKSTFLAKGIIMLLPAHAWDLSPLWGWWFFFWYREYYHQIPVTNLCTEVPALKMTVCAAVLAVGKFLWVLSIWEKQEWKKGTTLPSEERGDERELSAKGLWGGSSRGHRALEPPCQPNPQIHMGWKTTLKRGKADSKKTSSMICTL